MNSEELFLLHCRRSQWEKAKMNSNLCHLAWPHRIRRKMGWKSVGAGVLGFGNSLVSDAFSFCYYLLPFFFLLCFGCLLFFVSQIRRICMMILNTKVRFFHFRPLSISELYYYIFFNIFGLSVVALFRWV